MTDPTTSGVVATGSPSALSKPEDARPLDQGAVRSQAGGGVDDTPPQPGVWMFCTICDALQNLPICESCQAFARAAEPLFEW